MDAADFVEAYYDALRDGDPLHPYFASGDDVVKVGISERLVGSEAVADGLREQTRTTTDWTVESRDLHVTERERHAWFADSVSLAWTDTERRIRYEFETRWSGTLERAASSGESGDSAVEPGEPFGEPDDGDAAEWRFVGMHVSTARDL